MCTLSALLDDIKQSFWAARKVSYVLLEKAGKKISYIFVLILLFSWCASSLDWKFTSITNFWLITNNKKVKV